MKKVVFAAMLTCALIFVANSKAAQVILPDPNAKLSETVNIEPVSELPVIRPFEYKIRRGDNLTKLAKIFGTTVNELRAMNKENPSVKSKDLILTGGKLRVPLYSVESVVKPIKFYERIAANRAYQEGQDSKLPDIRGLVIISVALALLWCWWFLWGLDVKQRINEAETKNADVIKKLWETEDKQKALEKDFAHVHTKLSLAHEQLRLKEGADEEIRKQKQENDRLVETISELHTEQDRLKTEQDRLKTVHQALNSILRESVAETKSVLEGYAKCAEGALYSFESRDNGTIHGAYKVKRNHIGPDRKPVIDLLECTRCLAEVSPNNANCASHYFKPHENLTA